MYFNAYNQLTSYVLSKRTQIIGNNREHIYLFILLFFFFKCHLLILEKERAHVNSVLAAGGGWGGVFVSWDRGKGKERVQSRLSTEWEVLHGAQSLNWETMTCAETNSKAQPRGSPRHPKNIHITINDCRMTRICQRWLSNWNCTNRNLVFNSA